MPCIFISNKEIIGKKNKYFLLLVLKYFSSKNNIIVKLRTKKITNFELDRTLYDAINEFSSYKEKYPKLKNCEEYLKIEINLFESESEIIALRKYYNDIITDYNKLVKSFPSNLIALIRNYNTKNYFDGNNLDDDKKMFRL